MRRSTVAVAVAALLLAASAHGDSGAPGAQASRFTELASRAATALNAFWAVQLSNYTPPATVSSYEPGASAPCRMEDEENAFYCRPTEGVYYADALFTRMHNDHGEYSPVLILAHEFGHRIQHLLQKRGAQPLLWTIQRELQADCLAGAFTAHAQRKALYRGPIVAQSVQSLFSIGDEDSPWFAPGAHGRPGQRIDAFNEGVKGNACLGDALFVALGLDPAMAVQPPVPTRGTLEEIARRLVGRFRRDQVRRTPPVLVEGATEILDATYSAEDGVSLSVALMAFRNPEACAAAQKQAEARATAAGTTLVKRMTVVAPGRQTTMGSVSLYSGAREVVVWSNGRVLGIVEGPKDHAWEMATALL